MPGRRPNDSNSSYTSMAIVKLMRHTILILIAAVLATGLCGIAAAQIGGDTGYYYITSAPSGAEVYFDGTYQGLSPQTVAVPAEGTPGHTLYISLSGYQPYTQSFGGNPESGQTITIFANLAPLVGSETGYCSYQTPPLPGRTCTSTMTIREPPP